MFSEMTTLLILVEVGHAYSVKNIFTSKRYENIELTLITHQTELEMCG